MYSPSRFRSEGGGPDLVFGNAFWRKIHKRVIFLLRMQLGQFKFQWVFYRVPIDNFLIIPKKILKYNTLKIRIEDTA